MRTLYISILVLVAAGILVAGGCYKFDFNAYKPAGKGDPAARYSDSPAPPAAPAHVVSPAPPAGPVASASVNPTISPAPARAGNSGSGWADVVRQVAGEVFLDAEKGTLFYAFDTLAYPRQPVDLVAQVRSAKDLTPVAGVTVAFARGDWVAGRITTDAKGVAAMQWTPPARGNYSFEARIVGVPNESMRDMLAVGPSKLLVAAREKKAPQVVVDLDHTVVDSSFMLVMVGGGEPMADSVEVLSRIAKRYGVIYLTHRPDLLGRKSKAWLAENGYPSGPLLVSEIKDVLDSGKFKSAKLSALRRLFPGVAMGIGDKLSDAQAYVDNGMSAYLIPDYKEKPRNMRSLAAQLRVLRGRGRLHVVSTWRQIEQGVFIGRKFPPEKFAGELELRAARIEADQSREGRP